ncbi:MAG: nucleoside-triphosphatase [Rhodopseudomonas palustris]|nr:nucleoside-triphosphatase [Rhodopseudomonas palustris]
MSEWLWYGYGGCDLFIIDELGIVERSSRRFLRAVRKEWSRERKVLIVVQERAYSFWAERIRFDP